MLSVDVFLLCLIEIIPPTSFVVPLLGQYLLFTLTLVTVSVIATVYVLNVSFRNASSHKMCKFERWLYLDLLPSLLFMKKREESRCDEINKTKLVHCQASSQAKRSRSSRSSAARASACAETTNLGQHKQRQQQCRCPPESRWSEQEVMLRNGLPAARLPAACDDHAEQVISLCGFHHEIKNAFLSLDFVAKRMENRENYNKVSGVFIVVIGRISSTRSQAEANMQSNFNKNPSSRPTHLN